MLPYRLSNDTNVQSWTILVTGATGKVGRVFIKRLLAEPEIYSFTVRALCHNRKLETHERIQNVHDYIEYREAVGDESIVVTLIAS